MKDSFSFRDSFEYSNYYRYMFTAFHEPNLSIKPSPKPVFRLFYSSVMSRAIIILLSEDRITIKEQISGYGGPHFDIMKLTSKERVHYRILEDCFSNYKNQETFCDTSFLFQSDSLVHIPTYFQGLQDKALYFGTDAFKYQVKTVPISHRTFARLVKGINASNYWDHPFSHNCENPATDGFGVTLEANTGKVYKIIDVGFCPDYSSSYLKAWEEVIKKAGLHDRISLDWIDP